MQVDDKSDENLQYDGDYAEVALRQGFYNEALEADTDDTQQRIEEQHADVADFRAQFPLGSWGMEDNAIFAEIEMVRADPLHAMAIKQREAQMRVRVDRMTRMRQAFPYVTKDMDDVAVGSEN